MATEEYARPELLADLDWLWERRDDPGLRVIDCAPLDAYERAHIPGAIGLPVHVWLKETERGVHVMGAQAFSELMGRLGISNDTTVVTYDSFNTTYATRLWWVLNYYGHTNVKVLNGGAKRWLAEGRPITFHPTKPQAGNFTPRPNDTIVCRLNYLKTHLEQPGVQILNVLPEPHYRGAANPFANKRVGHIPGSLNVPIERFLSNDDRQVFKSAAELRAILTQAGFSPNNEVIVHCQAGVRTAMGFFVLALLGWQRMRAYDASMAEWANRDDTPLVLE